MSARIRSLDEFLTLLEGVKRTHDGQYMALCPAHHDTKPSLSVKEADGKILVQCFAGCDLTGILKPLGLEPSDLFLNKHKTKVRYREIEAVYHYVDANGKPFEVVRTRPKGFYQRRPDGKGGYIKNLKGIVPTLYHQDKLKQTIDSTEPVYLVEGEKDVNRLQSLGLVATTNPMGAGKWRDSYTEALRAADLIIIPDNDKPGRDHASHVAKSCYGIADRIRVLELPGNSKDISDCLDKGGSREQLEQLAAGCPEYRPHLSGIVTNDRQLRDITSDVLSALYQANEADPKVFTRSGSLVRVAMDEKDNPFINLLSESALRGVLTRVADFLTETMDEKGNTKLKNVSPPLEVVRDILSLGEWDFPPLVGITEVPVIRPDGSIVMRTGYDAATNLYYCPSAELNILPIPDTPTESDLRAARELVLEVICDFPFDSEASGANAVAAMFTPILRPMIEGLSPLAVFDKPQPGTGASLLAEVIALVATGRSAGMMTGQKRDEEWRKVITSTLLHGNSVIVIDNVDGILYSTALATVLTAPFWRDRILGHNEEVCLPSRVTWMATGNNIRLAGDLPRRAYWIRQDAQIAQPWLRDVKKFRHPNLEQWVGEKRGRILAAMLTVARAWVAAGKPEPPELPIIGSYESFCHVVGSVLAYMGIKGFLVNLMGMYKHMDVETPQWERFLEAWQEVFGEQPITVAELVNKLNESQDFMAALPDSLAGKDSREYSRRLGNALAKRNGVRYRNGLMITKSGERKHAATWSAVCYRDLENANSYGFSFKSELGGLPPTPCASENIKNGNDKECIQALSKTDSPNSPLTSKLGELRPSQADRGSIELELGMSTDEAVAIWQREGCPVIHLGPGENCYDLENLLSHRQIKTEHLAVIRNYLEKH